MPYMNRHYLKDDIIFFAIMNAVWKSIHVLLSLFSRIFCVHTCASLTTWCYSRLSVKHELKGNEHKFNFCLLNCPFYVPLVNYHKKLQPFVFFSSSMLLAFQGQDCLSQLCTWNKWLQLVLYLHKVQNKSQWKKLN